jgi:hypothetical protein
MAHGASIWMNTGRWAEAAGAALYLRGIDPAESLVAGFAQFEAGRAREGLGSFLHGALNHPRAARMLVGRGVKRPTTSAEARDHETGIDLLKDLHAYFPARARRSRRFFSRVLALPAVAALLAEVEGLNRRWFGQPGADRSIFERLNEMKALECAREHADRIAVVLALPEEPPAPPERRRRRGAVALVH